MLNGQEDQEQHPTSQELSQAPINLSSTDIVCQVHQNTYHRDYFWINLPSAPLQLKSSTIHIMNDMDNLNIPKHWSNMRNIELTLKIFFLQLDKIDYLWCSEMNDS